MKKRMWSLVLTGTLLLAGCGDDGEETKKNKETPKPTATQMRETPAPTPTATPEKPAEAKVPEGADGTYIFSSGAGAWWSEFALEEDGTFVGEYKDSNAGQSGEGYLATIYLCPYEGKFTDIKQIDDYSYSMTLSKLETEYKEGKEWIEDEVLYVASSPYGLEDGTEFILYTPDTPTKMLSDEFLSWWPLRYDADEKNLKVLGCYGIYNTTTEQGFFITE